nr:hypothetical protein [Tanacetum cinerariifolium]
MTRHSDENNDPNRNAVESNNCLPNCSPSLVTHGSPHVLNDINNNIGVSSTQSRIILPPTLQVTRRRVPPLRRPGRPRSLSNVMPVHHNVRPYNNGNAVHQTQSSRVLNPSHPTRSANHANVLNTPSSTRDISYLINFVKRDIDLHTRKVQLSLLHDPLPLLIELMDYNGGERSNLTPSTTIPLRITSSPLELSFVANTHVTTPPVRRPGRPPLQPNVVPPQRNVRPRLTRNDDHINMSTHSTPRIMLSSVTVVDTDGNPVHHTQLPTESNPSCPTKNVVHSLYNSTSTHDMSTSATIQQNDTNVPMRVHRMEPKNHLLTTAESPSLFCNSPQQVLPQSPLNSRSNGNRSLTPSITIPSRITSSPLELSFVANTHVTTPPVRRPGRPLLQPNVIPPRCNVRPRLTRNDDHINMSTHSTPRVMLSSVTIVDTDAVHHTQLPTEKNEVDNRFHALNLTNADNNIRLLVQYLIAMLNLNNLSVQSFRMARERFNGSSMQPVTLRLLGTRQRNAREYNLPTASEVAALVPGNGNPTECRDVIVDERHNPVKCIFELHPSFMALQYPLLFPYGEDVFQLEIPLNVPATTKRKYMSLRGYYCFRLQFEEGKTLHKAGRLFHAYCVDAYTAILDYDLDWYKRNQNTIRSELYNGLHDRIASGETNIQSLGQKFILPSTFTRGPRHMIQQYQDAMAICHWAGPPDLFVTMTCNPKWPEIERDVQNYIPCQPAADRPDTITRVFKMKLDDLMEDIQKGHHFGRVKAVLGKISHNVGVHVVYKDDIKLMTRTESWIPNHMEYGWTDQDGICKEDMQHGKWSKPSFLCDTKGDNVKYVRL